MKTYLTISITAFFFLLSCNNLDDNIHENDLTAIDVRTSSVFSDIRRSAEIVWFESRLIASNTINSRQNTVAPGFEDFFSFESRCLDAVGADDEFRRQYNMLSDENPQKELFQGDISSIFSANAHGSARLTSEDSLISISQSLSSLDLTPLINDDYYPEASQKIGFLSDRMIQLAESEETEIVENENYEKQEFQEKLKREVLLFEEEIAENEELSIEDKRLIFSSTSMLYLSLEDIYTITDVINNEINSSNGRVANFWKKAANALLEIAGVAAFATIVFTTAFFGAVIGTALCLSDYCWGTGGLIAAIGGVYVGSVVYAEITRHKYDI